MGIPKLWSLLKTCKIEIHDLNMLSGKVLAIDASIWLLDISSNPYRKNEEDNPDVFKQRQLLSLIYRICKLLYYGIYPVFVFDGKTPKLKIETIGRRQERRDQYMIRKTAKKLLQHNLDTLNEKYNSNFSTDFTRRIRRRKKSQMKMKKNKTSHQ